LQIYIAIMKRQLHVFSYSIKNQSNGEVDIFIDGQIVDAETQEIWRLWFGDETSTSYKSFREQLETLNAQVYNVYINSGGGMVTDAMAIHDLIKDYRANGKRVNTRGRGIVGSAATYILMAGDEPELSENSWFMIHNVSGGVWGDVNEVERYARLLRQFNDASRDFYVTATGKRKEDITKMMNEETWMTAKQAKDGGFIKKVTGEATFNQTISKENWPFANTAVLNAYNSAVRPAPNPDSITQQFDDMKKFFNDLGNAIMNAIKVVKAPENNDHTALMTSIGQAINDSIVAAGEQFETTVNETVTTAVTNALDASKDGPFKTALTNAIMSAIEQPIADAVKSATDFTKDGNAKTAFTSAINAAVTKAVKKAVDEATEEITNDITILKGKQSIAGDKTNDAPKQIGKWS